MTPDIYPAPKRQPRDLASLLSWVSEITALWDRNRDIIRGRVLEGEGDPEGVVTANIGTLYLRRDGGAGSAMYVKEADSGEATGWQAK